MDCLSDNVDSSFSTLWKRKEYRTEGLLRKQDKTPVVYDKKASLPIMLNLQKTILLQTDTNSTVHWKIVFQYV